MTTKEMKFRKPRIAWSVFCGLASVVLIALWVRSYWRHDIVWAHCSWEFVADSQWGECAFIILDPARMPEPWGLHYNSGYAQPYEPQTVNRLGFRLYTGNIYGNNNRRYLVVPHWFMVAIFAALAPVPWIRCQNRFGLRTLLIALTLVALVLGLGAYLSR